MTSLVRYSHHKPRLTWLVALLTATGLLLAATADRAPAAEVRLTGLKLTEDKGALVITVGLSHEVRPKVFTMGREGSRPRLVVDFPGCRGDGLPLSIKSPSPVARSVRTGVHPDKVRLVVDLKAGGDYLVEHWLKTAEQLYVLRISPR